MESWMVGLISTKQKIPGKEAFDQEVLEKY